MGIRRDLVVAARLFVIIGALLCLVGLFVLAPFLVYITTDVMFQESMTIFLITLLGSPILKLIISLILLTGGMNLLYVRRTKKWGVITLLLGGLLVIPPLLFGEPVTISLILLMLGPLPFIPYYIAGVLYLLAGFLGALWKP